MPLWHIISGPCRTEAMVSTATETTTLPGDATAANAKPKGKPKGKAYEFSVVQIALEEVQRYSKLLAEQYPDLADDEKAWADTLEGVTDAKEIVEALLNRYVDLERRVARIDADSAALKQILADNKARADRLDGQCETLKSNALLLLEAMTPEGRNPYIESDRFTAWKVRSSATKLMPVNPAATPDRFMKQPPKVPDNEAIRAELTAPPLPEEDIMEDEALTQRRRDRDALATAWVLSNARPSLTIKTR